MRHGVPRRQSGFAAPQPTGGPYCSALGPLTSSGGPGLSLEHTFQAEAVFLGSMGHKRVPASLKLPEPVSPTQNHATGLLRERHEVETVSLHGQLGRTPMTEEEPCTPRARMSSWDSDPTHCPLLTKGHWHNSRWGRCQACVHPCALRVVTCHLECPCHSSAAIRFPFIFPASAQQTPARTHSGCTAVSSFGSQSP